MSTNPDAALEQKSQQIFQSDVSACSVQGGPALEGDTNGDGRIDLLDLSNMIDWLGFNDSREDWADWHIYFDFNGNGEIDIYDIAYVARLVNVDAKVVSADESARAKSIVADERPDVKAAAPTVD